jgi:hypothetical protein
MGKILDDVERAVEQRHDRGILIFDMGQSRDWVKPGRPDREALGLDRKCDTRSIQGWAPTLSF